MLVGQPSQADQIRQARKPDLLRKAHRMPSLRCPVCKADNTQGPLCRRCKADLSLLFALEEQRRVVLDAARQAALRGEWRNVLAAAERADALRSDEESRRLLAVAHLLHGDFAEALQAAQRVSTPAVGTNA